MPTSWMQFHSEFSFCQTVLQVQVVSKQVQKFFDTCPVKRWVLFPACKYRQACHFALNTEITLYDSKARSQNTLSTWLLWVKAARVI